LQAEARTVFPGGVTRSVTWHEPYPTYMAEGCGCRVKDVDGNEYVDLVNNFSAMIHGHAHPALTTAMSSQAARGTDLGSPTALHIALARELQRRVPSMELLRLANSGTEATLYAVRAARAFTGRPKILKMEGSYHGGYDATLVSVNPGADAPAWPRGKVASAGLPPHVLDETLVAPFNNLTAVMEIIARHHADLAAVIVEPVMVRGMVPADADFVRGLRELTRERGILLIFDEVVTFRLATGGAQQLFGVTPDLTTLGKLIGGGLPVGAFGGRADVMSLFDQSRAGASLVQHSGTFTGNAATMAAGLAALELFTTAEAGRINALGERLCAGYRAALAARGVTSCVTGLGSLGAPHFTGGPVRDYQSAAKGDAEAARWMHLALLNRGIASRSGGGFYLSTATGEREIDETIQAFGDALDEVAPVYRLGG
jgi:glutamate-1-semialdehyde 2,1-aminomutase